MYQKAQHETNLYIQRYQQQTTFSGNDDNSNSLSYTVGQIDVFVNGVRQDLPILQQPMEHQSY